MGESDSRPQLYRTDALVGGSISGTDASWQACQLESYERASYRQVSTHVGLQGCRIVGLLRSLIGLVPVAKICDIKVFLHTFSQLRYIRKASCETSSHNRTLGNKQQSCVSCFTSIHPTGKRYQKQVIISEAIYGSTIGQSPCLMQQPRWISSIKEMWSPSTLSIL